MKKEIIVNGKRVAEIGRPEDFIIVSGPNVPKPKQQWIVTDGKTKYKVTEEDLSRTRRQQPIPTDYKTLVKSKREQELEQNKKEWDKYLVDNRGKIPSTIPKTIFDSNKDE